MISWGATAPNSAVSGLATLLQRREWRSSPRGERVRQLLSAHLDSPDDVMRMLASGALPFLVAPENLLSELSVRLSREENGPIREVLLVTLANHAPRDPKGVDACLRDLASNATCWRLVSAPEDRSVPPNERHSAMSDTLLRILLHLGLDHTTPFASARLSFLQQEPQQHPATVGRLVAWTRSYLNPPGDTATITQARAFRVLETLTDVSVSTFRAVRELIASGATPSDEDTSDLESVAWIAHCVAREIYHASGAFQPPDDRARAGDRIVSPSFCSLALPLIEKLAQVPNAAVAHHLVQTLEFLSRLEPKRAFMAVARIATPGSAYQLESMAESKVLDVIDLHLAERRDLVLNDPDCLSGMRQLLETFVAVGSDRAVRRVMDLDELFR